MTFGIELPEPWKFNEKSSLQLTADVVCHVVLHTEFRVKSHLVGIQRSSWMHRHNGELEMQGRSGRRHDQGWVGGEQVSPARCSMGWFSGQIKPRRTAHIGYDSETRGKALADGMAAGIASVGRDGYRPPAACFPKRTWHHNYDMSAWRMRAFKGDYFTTK
jgi:hypothetical protein